jgi:hypothetical protein
VRPGQGRAHRALHDGSGEAIAGIGMLSTPGGGGPCATTVLGASFLAMDSPLAFAFGDQDPSSIGRPGPWIRQPGKGTVRGDIARAYLDQADSETLELGQTADPRPKDLLSAFDSPFWTW